MLATVKSSADYTPGGAATPADLAAPAILPDLLADQAIYARLLLLLGDAHRIGPGHAAGHYHQQLGADRLLELVAILDRYDEGAGTADAVAAEILKTPIRRASRTSISGAITFAMPLFDEDPYRGLRRVIDISGDGPNNNGTPVTIARDAAIEKGIVINGLPIMVKEPSYSTMDIDNLDFYYEDCVIGGPGSFVITIKDRDKFKEAIRTKLLMEVAGRMPERPVMRVADKDKEPRVNCMIGEKIWSDRWGR